MNCSKMNLKSITNVTFKVYNIGFFFCIGEINLQEYSYELKIIAFKYVKTSYERDR